MIKWWAEISIRNLSLNTVKHFKDLIQMNSAALGTHPTHRSKSAGAGAVFSRANDTLLQKPVSVLLSSTEKSRNHQIIDSQTERT